MIAYVFPVITLWDARYTGTIYFITRTPKVPSSCEFVICSFIKSHIAMWCLCVFHAPVNTTIVCFHSVTYMDGNIEQPNLNVTMYRSTPTLSLPLSVTWPVKRFSFSESRTGYDDCIRKTFSMEYDKLNARHKVQYLTIIFYEITNRCSYMQSILFHC